MFTVDPAPLDNNLSAVFHTEGEYLLEFALPQNNNVVSRIKGLYRSHVTQQPQRVLANIIPGRTVSKERHGEYEVADRSVTNDRQMDRVSSRRATLFNNPWRGRGSSKCSTRLPPARAPTVADLQAVELGLEGLDSAVRELEIFVESVALLDELNGVSVYPSLYAVDRKNHVRAAPTA